MKIFLWSKKHKFWDLAMFSKNMGHSQNFTDTIWIVQGVWFFSRILFWNIEKWMFGPLGQANSPLTESNTLYLFIAHRECNRLIHRYLFSVKKLWGQYGHVYGYSIFLYSSVITSKLVTLCSVHFLSKRYWDNTFNRLGIKEAIFSISLAGTVMGL